MKILITGSTGLLGQALVSHLAPSCDVTGLSRHQPMSPQAGRHVACDLLDAQRTSQTVTALRPEAVIHTQAMSDVDQCEREPEEASSQNVRATEHLVQALEGTSALFVYVSTDYVFDGRRDSPYDEAAEPNPLSVYGRSKLAGERAALASPRGIVVRPSTLFGPARMNFCDAVARAARGGQAAEAFVDQTTSPTYTVDCSEAIGELIAVLSRPNGSPRARIFHVANQGACTRLEFAYRVVDLLGCSRQVVRPIHVADQRRPALRPAYSALTTTELPNVIGRTLRPWDEALAAYLRERRWLN